MLRRVGEVLHEAVKAPGHGTRSGGEEFAIVLPYVDEQGAASVVEDIERLVEINNQYYSTLALSLSIGVDTSQDGEELESVAKRGNVLMYENKHKRSIGPCREDCGRLKTRKI